MPRTEDPYHFLDLSFGYYMTGRFAAINQLNVAPNLIHHAVELLMKFTLLKNGPERLRSAATKDLGDKYRLNALWAVCKQKVASASQPGRSTSQGDTPAHRAGRSCRHRMPLHVLVR